MAYVICETVTDFDSWSVPVLCEGTIPCFGRYVIFSDNRMEIIAKGPMPDWDRPQTVPWRAYAGKITCIFISDGVTSIGNHAFSGFYNLISVSMMDGLERVGANAFHGCLNLESIALPDTVTMIDTGAFAGCVMLRRVLFSRNLETIRNCAFSGCEKLSSIRIANRLRRLEDTTLIRFLKFAEVSYPDCREEAPYVPGDLFAAEKPAGLIPEGGDAT